MYSWQSLMRHGLSNSRTPQALHSCTNIDVVCTYVCLSIWKPIVCSMWHWFMTLRRSHTNNQLHTYIQTPFGNKAININLSRCKCACDCDVLNGIGLEMSEIFVTAQNSHITWPAVPPTPRWQAARRTACIPIFGCVRLSAPTCRVNSWNFFAGAELVNTLTTKYLKTYSAIHTHYLYLFILYIYLCYLCLSACRCKKPELNTTGVLGFCRISLAYKWKWKRLNGCTDVLRQSHAKQK